MAKHTILSLGLPPNSAAQGPLVMPTDLHGIMDRRMEPRQTAKQSVWITSSRDPQATQRGYLVEVSGNGLKLFLPDPLPAGATISIECQDCAVGGKVTYCFESSAPLGQREWQVGIEVLHRPWELVEPLVGHTNRDRIRDTIGRAC